MLAGPARIGFVAEALSLSAALLTVGATLALAAAPGARIGRRRG